MEQDLKAVMLILENLEMQVINENRFKEFFWLIFARISPV